MRLITICFCGILFTAQSIDTQPLSGKKEHHLIKVEFQKNNYAYITILKSLNKNKEWADVNEKAIIYKKHPIALPRTSIVNHLEFKNINALKGSKGYKNFLYKLNVKHFAHLSHESTLQSTPISFYAQTRIDILNYIQDKWKEAELNETSFSIFNAILLGEKSLLNDTTKRSFRMSGTMHLLVVSGLHIGILFFLLTVLFSPLKFLPHGPVVKHVFVLLFLWLFIALVGFTTAANRAGFMITAYILAQLLNREYKLLNTLAFCAFINLMLFPDAIFNIGFLLSYGAVLGIALFLPLWKKIVCVKNKITSYFLDIIGVSIAVQLIISPLLILFFNQLSLIGLIANLYAIPLSFLTLCLLIGSLLFSFNNFLFLFFTTCADKTSHLLLYCNNYVSSLPFANTTLNLSSVDISLYYTVLLLFIFIIHYKNYHSVYRMITGTISLILISLCLPI